MVRLPRFVFRVCCLLFMSSLAASVVRAGEYACVKNARGTFHLYRARPEELTLHWKNAEGHAFRTFTALEDHFTSIGHTVSFMINAGIFEPGGTPTGLHIEEGREIKAINLADAPGNFYLKPNGVFLIDDQGAKILTSQTYAAAKLNPRIAFQSGPMLLINGAVHPAFRAASENLLHRNGVGILPDGRILFIITDLPSQTRINLYHFAMLFQNYGCQNALFLDGDLSVMAVRKDDKLKPVDSEDVESRELAPGVRAGHEFGAILSIATPIR